MFDLGKLGDISKLAGQAKELHQMQERVQREQIELLKKITGQLDEVISLLKKDG